MNLTGKSREEIDRLLSGKTRGELIDEIFKLVTVEQHFRPSEIAARSGMSKRTILADLHSGKFGGEFYKRSETQITVSAAGVNAWRQSFRVAVKPQPNDAAGKET